MVEWAAACVKQVHDKGKKAILFYCDHWIGTEPYKPAFQQIGYDGIIGPCINGREVRRVADVPGELVKELRLYPYFFEVDLLGEPTFKEGGDPVRDCRKYWMWIRRAMLRKLVHRIGYGGYLDLAIKFPDFVDYLDYQTREYYKLCENTQFTPVENAPFKVGILNAWGRHRSWGFDMTWPLGNITESLSGQPFDLEWLSFDDIRGGVPEEFGVILNFGLAGTSWSGGENWTDPRVVSAIREFVDNGGCGTSSACRRNMVFPEIARRPFPQTLPKGISSRRTSPGRSRSSGNTCRPFIRLWNPPKSWPRMPKAA